MAALSTKKLTFKKGMCQKVEREAIAKDYVKERQGPVTENRRTKARVC